MAAPSSTLSFAPSPPDAERAPRWTRRKKARPNEIIAAALEAFSENGYAGTRIEDIAQRAGVTKGTVYLYFKSKEELFKAAVLETMASVIVSNEELFNRYQGSTADLLREIVISFWQRISSSRAGIIPKLVMAESGKFPEIARFYYHAVIEPGRALNRRVIERGIRLGEFRPVNAEDYTPLIIAPAFYLLMCRNTFEPFMPGTTPPASQLLETYIEMLLRGLRRDDSVTNG